MTSRQAKHQAKQRADGAVTIAVTFRADEPEAEVWKELVQWFGSPKKAMSELTKQTFPIAKATKPGSLRNGTAEAALAEYKRMLSNKTTFGIDNRHE
jgi:hypothetical protein